MSLGHGGNARNISTRSNIEDYGGLLLVHLQGDEVEFVELLELLGYQDGEFVSIASKTADGLFVTEVCSPSGAADRVAGLADSGDVYFGVNPTAGPARANAGRGAAADVTRLAALVADLDIGEGKCSDLATAMAIVDALSNALGMRPAVVTHSGGGLHPYWPIKDGQKSSEVDLAATVKRWGRLVKRTSKEHGAAADSVFDLARVLRVPGTRNWKRGEGRPVRCERDVGTSLTLREVGQRLNAASVDNPGESRSSVGLVSDADLWEYAEKTCSYVRSWLDDLTDDGPLEGGGRHQWVGTQAVRFACARRLGCISEADYLRARQLVEDRLRKLRAKTGEAVPAGEVPDWWRAGVERAGAKTDEQVRAELGNHKHLWPAPDAPRDVARRVVQHAKRTRRPLRFWNGLWFAWCGTHYQRMTVEGLRDELYDLLADATYQGANSELRWKPTTKKLNDVIDAMRGLVALPAGIGASDWLDGRKELVIPCANGLLRVKDRMLLEHTPEHFHIMSLPYSYIDGASCPRWHLFLDEVFRADADAVALLQQWFGYVLSGRTDLQKMLMWLGPKRGGKGTVARLMKRLIGPAAYAAMTVDALRRNFALQNLIDKSLVVFPDERQVGAPDGKRLVQFILHATGEDDVQVERKYKDAWNGRLPMRLMYMGNEMPVLPDSSGAVANRILMVETVVSFANREERGLDETLAAELPGILNWSLDGLDHLQENREFKQPESGLAVARDIDDYSNHVRRFLQSAGCELRAGARTECNRLWAAFNSWCGLNGVDGKLTAVWFGRQLRPAMRDLAPEANFDRVRDQSEEGRPYYYTGIGLPANEPGMNRRW